MLRSFFLALSRSRYLQRQTVQNPLMRRMARRFVAGETLAEGIAATRALVEAGRWVALDHLGENVTNPDQARAAAAAYLEALDELEKAALTEGGRTTVSIKLSQMGLSLDPELAFAHAARIADRAHQAGTWLEIDMEDSPTVDATLQIYRRLKGTYPHVRLCLQAYLYRTWEDYRSLLDLAPSIRLVKGAYKEPAEVAYPKKAEVNASFLRLSEAMLSDEALEKGVYPAFATHDEDLIRRILTVAESRQVPRDRYEFQLLYGVRRDLQEELVQAGYRVRIYVPYGAEWYPYFMRRLAERPANVLFLARALLRG